MPLLGIRQLYKGLMILASAAGRLSLRPSVELALESS